jgi:hypothetical protein
MELEASLSWLAMTMMPGIADRLGGFQYERREHRTVVAKGQE